jgi:outer membrane lipoprotein
MRYKIFLLASLATLGGCATMPAPLSGEFAGVSPKQAGSAQGQRVRWGGEIIKVDPKADVTCFEILARDLSSQARPVHHDESEGRFLACRQGFYDPAVFTAGREVTVVGAVAGSEKRPVGDFEYSYPRVNADVVYLWPKRPLYTQNYDPWPYYGPYWGWGWWGPPVVIVRHRFH